MYIHRYVYIYIYIHIYKNVYQVYIYHCISIYAYIYICIYIYVCIYIRRYIYIYMYMFLTWFSLFVEKCGKTEKRNVLHVWTHKGYRMYNSDTISILSCAFDWPCFVTHAVYTLFGKWESSKISSIGCESKFCVSKLLLKKSRSPQRTGNILEISIAWRKYLCVSGKVV